MRLFYLLIIFYFILIQSVHSQNKNDLVFILSEKAVNKVFTAIGEINGKSEYEVFGIIKGDYFWKINNARILFMPDSSQFNCDAEVKVGPFTYKSKVPGQVKIDYNNKIDKITIKITQAVFELYTMFLKKKIHIKNIHLEDYFKEPFTFDGPKSYKSTVNINMPDSTVKIINLQPSDCEIKVTLKAIKTSCDIKAESKTGVR